MWPNPPLFYLGIPLFVGHKKIVYFDKIIEKVEGRIFCWFNKELNHARKIQLISSILNSMPLYTLQVIKSPKKTIDRLEKAFNIFLWGSTHSNKKIHWSSWSKLCCPKNQGGIGTNALQLIAKAFQTKLWWILKTKNNLWTKYITFKYGRNLHPTNFIAKTYDSPIWKFILQGRANGEKSIFWTIGKGQVLFWRDKWHPRSPFIQYVNNTCIDFSCFEVWTQGQWDLIKLYEKVVPQSLWEMVGHIAIDPNIRDQPRWMLG